MKKDKTVTSAPPSSGALTVLFGIACDDPAIVNLKFDTGPMAALDIRLITPYALAQGGWTLAICTLFSTQAAPHHEAVAVIEVLAEAGFKGELVVLAPPLLRPKMVEQELRAMAKGMKLHFIAGALPPLTEF